MEIKTDKIYISQGEIIKILIYEYGIYWISVLLLIFLGFLITGIIIDLRFCILGFLWICIMAPLQLAFLYFYHALKPLTSINRILHDINFYSENLKINLYSEEVRYEEINNTDDKYEKRILKTKELSIRYETISKILKGTQSLLIFFSGEKGGVLALPYSSINVTGITAIIETISPFLSDNREFKLKSLS